MGKSKQKKSNRNRNNGRNKKKNRVLGDEASSISDDIEAQLERQRRKRALNTTSETLMHDEPPESLGNLQYDHEKKTYFPKDMNTRRNQKRHIPISITKSKIQNIDMMRPGFPIFTEKGSIGTSSIYAVNDLCLNQRKIESLRFLWMGRLISTRAQVISSVKRQYDSISHKQKGWGCLLAQLARSSNAEDRPPLGLPWDLGCKMHLHGSSRTFDVQQGPDESRLPDIATLVDGGAFVRFATSDPRVWSERRYFGAEWDRSTHLETHRGLYNLRFKARDDGGFPGLDLLSSKDNRSVHARHFRPGQILHDTTQARADLNDAAYSKGALEKGLFLN